MVVMQFLLVFIPKDKQNQKVIIWKACVCNKYEIKKEKSDMKNIKTITF